VTDLAKTDEQRAIVRLIFSRQVMGRPFALPPGVAQERVAELRKAFDATMADKDYLADAAKMKLEVKPVSGEQIEHLIDDIYRTTSPAIARKANEMIK